MAMTFQRARLDNGLTVVAEVDPGAHSAAAGFFVKTGARDESLQDMGVSHFLEHMMFKGTADLSAEEINRGFDDLGARNNAYTTHELTAFHAHVVPEVLPQSLDLLARMMRPALRQDDFDTEKGVILEEIAMYKDNPFWVLYESCMEHHYGSHPLGYRVLGTEDSIKAMPSERMRAYFERHYAADNTTVALAGNLDFDAAVGLLQDRCGSWNRSGLELERSLPVTAPSPMDIRDERVNRAYVLMLADGPGIGDERRYAASLLAFLLGGSDNSRLHWSMIETGLAEEAQADFQPYDGTGLYMAYASGDPAKATELVEALDSQIGALIDSITHEDLERLRTKLATQFTVGGERPADRMHRLGRLWSYLGAYRSLEQELDAILDVTLDDIREVHEAFPLSARTVGTLGPA